MTEAQLQPISLRRLPLPLWHESRRWFEELLREFAVIASEVEDTTPRDLLAFVDQTTERFGQFSEASNLALESAHAAGDAELDLELRLPAGAAPVAGELRLLIERAREFCRRGDLLTMEPAPEVFEFVEWYLAELENQLAGAKPRPWTSQPAAS